MQQSLTALWPVPSHTAWWQKHTGVISLPKGTVQWCRRLKNRPVDHQPRQMKSKQTTTYWLTLTTLSPDIRHVLSSFTSVTILNALAKWLPASWIYNNIHHKQDILGSQLVYNYYMNIQNASNINVNTCEYIQETSSTECHIKHD